MNEFPLTELAASFPLRSVLGAILFLTLIIWGLMTAALIFHWRRSVFKKRVMVLAETSYLVGSLIIIAAATAFLAAA